jgi:FAD/FMN-containing dehydrogenase
MLTRRQFTIGAILAGSSLGCSPRLAPSRGVVVNDVHSQLNPTQVDGVLSPVASEELERIVRQAAAEGRSISIAGGRHAMGGQQFGAGTVLVDTRRMNRVLRLDTDAGLVQVEAGIEWPELVEHLIRSQEGREHQWGIVQKQTGADRLSIGGALAANAHGRGLRWKPMIADVESITLVGADGVTRTCSRRQNTELFRLAIGGYGLFGIMASVTLRLAPRRTLERVVQVLRVDDLMPAFERRIAGGFLFGDFQYATDERSEDFLRRGVFSCYRPVEHRTPPAGQKELSESDWRRLLYLSHADKRRAFAEYAAYYLSTSGQLYWSDTHQLSVYIDDYHRWLDRELGATAPATEMISEVYVPRPLLVPFLDDVRRELAESPADVIYGTIRLIERDDESFLAWAKDRYACLIFNLHVVHTPEGIERATRAFRLLIDLARARGGSYYLTYHRWATRQQVEACYPQFAEFLRIKRRYDPAERFQSDWYRHHRTMFA